MKFKASLIIAASLILSAAVGTAVNAESGKEQIKKSIEPQDCVYYPGLGWRCG